MDKKIYLINGADIINLTMPAADYDVNLIDNINQYKKDFTKKEYEEFLNDLIKTHVNTLLYLRDNY